MAFILNADLDLQDYRPADIWRRYRDYLESRKAAMPPGVFTIATSSWWYSHEEPGAPHDSCLEKLEMGDAMDRDPDGDIFSIKVRLASCHTGHILLHYYRVHAYSLEMSVEDLPGHGHWRLDEFSSDGTPGRFTHTIEWADGPTWRITACELIHQYLPGPCTAGTPNCS